MVTAATCALAALGSSRSQHAATARGGANNNLSGKPGKSAGQGFHRPIPQIPAANQITILYWADFVIATDQMQAALQGLPAQYSVTIATDEDDFATKIASGNYQVGILFIQSAGAQTHASAAALDTFVAGGGKAIYADWSQDDTYAAAFDAGFTSNVNDSSVTVTEPRFLPNLPSNPFALTNPGWGVFSTGLTPLAGGSTAATFSNAEAAIVIGNSDRTIMNGFLNDTVPSSDLFRNEILFLTTSGCAPAPDGMVSWWKAEDNPNDSQDGNNGSLKNGATFAPGKVGQAFSLDGTDDYVEVSDSPNISFTGPFTIDAWINTNDNTTEHGIVEKYDGSGQNGYFFRISNGTGKLAFGICNGVTCDSVGGATQISTGTFHHVAAVYDGTSLKVYLDGNLDGSNATGSAPTDGTNPLEIGARGGSPFNFFSGLIDEVELFNKALSDTDIGAIFAAGSEGKCPCTTPPDDMISWWPGDNNFDDIVDGNNMTPTNGTVGFGSGEVRQAFSFNGGGYLSTGDPDNLRLTGTEVTLDAWVNPTNAGESGVIAGKTSSGANDYLLYLSGGTVVGLIKSGGSEITIAGGVPPPGEWTHVALVYDGSTVKTYYDGAPFASTPKTGNLDGSNSEVAIGGRSAGDLQLVGFVDEVEIFGRALDASEIAEIYVAGGAGKCRTCTPAPAGMVGWWRGNGNTNDEIAHNDGTLQNGATFGAGEVDQGFSLDGNDDSVAVIQTPNSSNEITLDAWINPSTLNLDQIVGPVVFEKGVSLFNRIGMQIKEDGSLCGYLNSDVLNVCSSPGVIQTHQFTHVALTLRDIGDGVHQLTLYANGQQVAQVNGTDSLNVGTAGLVIGDSPTSGFFDNFAGIIDEVEMFDRALAQGEIQKIFDAGTAGKCSCTTPPKGMTHWWPADGNAEDI